MQKAHSHHMYTGTLILDLLDIVDRAEKASGWKGLSAKRSSTPRQRHRKHEESVPDEIQNSESKQLAQPLGLSSTDRNLSLLPIVHPELIRTFEPGDNLADTVDIHEIRAVGAPE